MGLLVTNVLSEGGKMKRVCEFEGSHSSAAEEPVLWGCDPVLLAEWFLAFQRIATVPSDRWELLAKEHSVSVERKTN